MLDDRYTDHERRRAQMTVDRANLKPFPTAAFISFWIGFAVIFWTPIGAIMAGLLGLAFGTAFAVLSKNSQWLFEPIETSDPEKRRFLRRTAILQIVFTPLLIAVAAYFLPKITRFIFPAAWVAREPAVLCYTGGVSMVLGFAIFISSGKYA